MKPRTSIDRLTILGDLEGGFRDDGKAYGAGVLAAVDTCRAYSEATMCGKYPYRSAFSLAGGGFVSFAGFGSSVPLVRVDWNPNTLEAGAPLNDVLALMFDTRCSRLDVAVDYPDQDVVEWLPMGRSAKRFEVQARGGRIETTMIGARSSARQLVVYDKVADARAKGEAVPWGHDGPMMRVEARERYKPDRAAGVLAPDLLDDVTLSRRGGEWRGLNVKDRALLHYLGEFPAAWCEVARNTKRRLESLAAVQGSESLQPSPGSIYRRALSELQGVYLDAVGGVGSSEVMRGAVGSQKSVEGGAGREESVCQL